MSRKTTQSDVDKAGSVVLVVQGTLVNDDLGQLVGPTLTAVANEDLTMIASTGGPPVESIPAALPPNAKVAAFWPLDRPLPEVSVMVTNGGYGAVNYALSLGVPLVVAGDSEEKPEIAAWVAWAGAGINLGTGRPSVAQIREAVRAVLIRNIESAPRHCAPHLPAITLRSGSRGGCRWSAPGVAAP